MGLRERRGGLLLVQAVVVVAVVAVVYWTPLFSVPLSRRFLPSLSEKAVQTRERGAFTTISSEEAVQTRERGAFTTISSEEAVQTRERGEEAEGKELRGKSDGAADAGSCPPSKRILAWTTFGKHHSQGWERIFYRLLSRQCPESRCELVYNRKLLDSADAVLFHALDVSPSYILPERRRPNQPWIFYSHEAPPSAISRVKLDRLGGLFNWTMTYRRDSDVVAPYGIVLPKPAVTPRPDRDVWSSKSRKNMAAWTVSHCHTESRREVYVKELAKHISVDIFGGCGKKKCGKSLFLENVGTFNQTACNEQIEEYMFYLAFENSICLDYVTEKLYQALTLNVVPVVLGGADYNDVAPPHSVIDALAFPSPKELAGYLKRLAENRDDYNRYFAWKQYFTVELGHPFAPLVCDLCAMLHDPAALALPAATRSSPSGRAGVRGVAPGRDGNGSYPDIDGWFIKASECRRWEKGFKDHRIHTADMDNSLRQ